MRKKQRDVIDCLRQLDNAIGRCIKYEIPIGVSNGKGGIDFCKQMSASQHGRKIEMCKANRHALLKCLNDFVARQTHDDHVSIIGLVARSLAEQLDFESRAAR